MIEEHDDDKPIGRVLSRREVMGLLGGAGAAFVLGGCTLEQFLSGAATDSGTTAVATEGATAITTCVVKPALTEGPYFVDAMLNRSDIRTDPSDGSVSEGVPLRITVHVSQLDDSACIPLEGAQVDVWHCDALGVYSGVQDRSFDTSESLFLRGYQVTDANGNVEFTTIYPGWYPGRAVHIHFKIRTDPASNAGYEFTSQFFFDDSQSDEVFTQEPYASKGQRDTLNTNDGIFQGSAGELTLQVSEDGEGYAALFDIALDMR